ncbi:hypothetical protein QS257_19875 [Terrilactibacillus sp. S3-3]|nr:hypothetical protein QS257_19875 [Terrilactibacillus sp. S3-3]
MERTIKISIKELLKFLKAIDGVPDEMYSVLREKGLLKMPINKVKGANEVDTSGFTTIFLEAMNCAYMDFQYKIAHELGMPEYDIDNSSVYDYVEMMFITYYNEK